MSENKGVQFVKSRNGLYGSVDGRFEIERFDAGTPIPGLSGLNNAFARLSNTESWVAFEHEDGKRYPLGRSVTLRGARELIAAHLDKQRAEAK